MTAEEASPTSEPALTVVGDVRPAPTDEEMAAIMVAVEMAWSRPVPDEVALTPSRWRFSGRWWSKPLPTRRARP